MIYTQKIVKFKKIYEDIVYPKEIELEEVDIISYYDKENNILGCSHYQRKCYIFAECCKKYYPCRLCHNKSENHEVERSTIKTVRCMKCFNEQVYLIIFRKYQMNVKIVIQNLQIITVIYVIYLMMI